MSETDTATAPVEVTGGTEVPVPPKNPYAGTKHKVKIDGVEQEVSYEDMLADYQHKISSNKRFEQANKIKKDVDSLFEAIKKGDLSFVKQNVSPELLRKFAEKELIEYLEYEQMSPEQKEALSAKQERDQLKKEKEDRDKTDRETQIQSIHQQTSVEIENEIIEAVKSLGHDIKVTPRLIRRIAEQMQHSLVASDDPQAQHMPAKLAAERAWNGLKKDHEEYLSLVKPEDYISMLPPKLRDAIRKADVESVVSQMPTSVRNMDKPSYTSTAQTSSQPKLKRMSTDDWFSRMETKISKRG